jgi:hypothetical protein
MHLKTSKQQLSLRYKALGAVFSLSSIILIAPHALALGEVEVGGFQSSVVANSLYWNYDSTTVSPQQINAYIGQGAAQWNAITPKANLAYSLTQPYRIKVSLSNTGVSSNVAGEMIPICPSGTGLQCRPDKNWTVAAIIGYENVMTASGFTTTNRIANFAHEFGHALSMSHVSVNAAMRTGKLNYGVQQYDRDNLKYKWGQ